MKITNNIKVNNLMVYDANTYELYHELEPNAKDLYCEILEDAATEMLFKHNHPLKWLLEKAIALVSRND